MPAPSPSLLRLSATWPEVEIIHQDESLLALNKPAGLPVAPNRQDKTRENLIGLLHAGIRAQRPWVIAGAFRYLANTHRLDQGTSGVILLARTKATLVNLAAQFRDQHPRAIYVALVCGTPESPDYVVELPLAPHPTEPGLTVVSRRGKPASTRFRILERFRGYTLVSAEPATERQHQIAVHLAATGCPLVADSRYGSGQPLLLSQLKRNYKMKPEGERPLLARTALHAASLQVVHPATGQALTLEAPWAHDLTVAVKYLRRFAAT